MIRMIISAAAAMLLASAVIAQNGEIKAGRKAPNFRLENLNNNYVELRKEIGKGPILLSFWATWCKPCVEELGEFSKMYEQFKDKGFKLFAISTDNEKSVAKVKPFIKSKGYNFPVLLDTNSETARIYYARSIPYSVLLDKDGNIVYTHQGYLKGDELQIKKKLDQMLKD